MVKRKFAPQKQSLDTAVNGALSDLREDLGAEIREVVDGASGTNRENTARIQILSETADTLEGLDEPTIPDAVAQLEVTWQDNVARSKRHGLSRGDRRDNACSALDGAIAALDEYIDKCEDDDDKSEAETLRDELDDLKSQAEGCEFPGMYG